MLTNLKFENLFFISTLPKKLAIGLKQLLKISSDLKSILHYLVKHRSKFEKKLRLAIPEPLFANTSEIRPDIYSRKQTVMVSKIYSCPLST